MSTMADGCYLAQSFSAEMLLADVRKSPLLPCSLIAVRQEIASSLTPQPFKEVEALLSVGLLETPQTIEFFQAALILSLWSTARFR